jgi:RNA polymerase sigma-70 factor (ECF subfamily)
MLPHMGAAYNFARYLTRDPLAAEDLVQDAFVNALRGFDGWRGDAPKSWLLAIVRNCFLVSLTAGRAAVGAREFAEDEADALAATAHHQTPEALLALRQDAALLRATVERLPEPFREALVLRELEELSYKDVAAVTGAPIGTVMSRLARGRQMLERWLPPLMADAGEAAE